MRSLARTSRLKCIIGCFENVLRGGAAHDQQPRRINTKGMKPRRIEPAIFA